MIVGAFNKDKALIVAFSVIVKSGSELDQEIFVWQQDEKVILSKC